MSVWSFDEKKMLRHHVQFWFFALIHHKHWVFGSNNSTIMFLEFFYAILIFGSFKTVEKWVSYGCWKFLKHCCNIFMFRTHMSHKMSRHLTYFLIFLHNFNNFVNPSKHLILRWFFAHLSFNTSILWLCQKIPKMFTFWLFFI